MNGKIAIVVVIAAFMMVYTGVNAQVFNRAYEIPVPEADLNNGGVGAMVAGVDIDGDGLLEIYLINDNWNDDPSELIPRIYKLEQDAADNTAWNIVWQAVAPVAMQNTWPPLTTADLDKDGKTEIIWGVINNTGDEPNPDRILVYETAGDGSDVMGVSDGFGGYTPNAKWTITSEEGVNVRPSSMTIADPDNDGTDEIIFSDRAGNSDGYYFAVCSVSDVPDAGDGSETWTLESSGLDFGDLTADPKMENKWDVAVIGNNIYTFCEYQITKLSWDGYAWNLTKLDSMAGGAAFNTSQVVDLDGDSTEEIICGVYDWADDDHKAIMLLQEEGDGLVHTELASLVDYWPTGSRGVVGSAMGDIDQDGYMDFVFGSRAATPNGALFRLAYKGGDITNPANYEFTVIDSLYIEEGCIWSVIDIANVDDDPELEVIYTSSVSYSTGTLPNIVNTSPPIVVLDYSTSVGVFTKKTINPEGYALVQNYPNPFNPTTSIRFAVPNEQHVTLTIFNVKGEVVKTLINGTRSAGSQVVQWDGTDNFGHAVTSGQYIYRLQAGDYFSTRTMTFIK
jgi:hypothetical protein